MASKLKTLFWGAVICGLFFVILLIGAGGRLGCIGSRYERFDFFIDGVRQGNIQGASPSFTILDTILIPGSVKAYNAFYNVTEMRDCAREEKYAARISFVELRSAALTGVVERWHTSQDPSSGFRSGDIWKDRVIVSQNLDRPTYQVWDPVYVEAAAPGWVPLAQLNEANVIAFWGDGHLFRGTKPDQYYWVGYR